MTGEKEKAPQAEMLQHFRTTRSMKKGNVTPL